MPRVELHIKDGDQRENNVSFLLFLGISVGAISYFDEDVSYAI